MSLGRVAVTGLGSVSALGMTAPAMWDGILAGRCGIGPIHDIETGRLSTPIAAQLEHYDPDGYFEPKRAALLDRVGQLATIAGREAVGQTGLARADFAALGGKAGVIFGATNGQVTLDACYLSFYGQTAQRLHPFTVPRIMGNAGACNLSIEFGLTGACFATSSACASATHAIGTAFDAVRLGRLAVCITGGADASIVPGFIKGWEGLRVLSSDNCRPFSKDRSGLVLGEGAGALVLEDWSHATSRGAEILAEITGFGMSADAADMTAPDAGGAARAMQAALDDAALPPAAIGYVNAHGTGTRLNDRTESAALRLVFGKRVPPVSSTKSQIGHCLNAAGGLEAVAAVMGLRAQVLPPTVNFRQPDPDCIEDCVAEGARPAAFEHALSNSFAFGGLNARARLAPRRVTVPHINRIGTAVPAHDVHAAFIDYARTLLPVARGRTVFDRMAERSGIAHRFSCLQPGRLDRGEVDAGGFYQRGAFPSTGARMAMYERHAAGLALQAIADLDEDLSQVTHLVVASCTGFSAPGLDQHIAEALGLADTLQRSLLGFMGCSAAVPALRAAFHHVRSDPSARVLVVNLELCSLHLQETGDLATVLSFLLFGDAATAALVTAEPRGVALRDFRTRRLPDSAGCITWHIGDQGFRMHLSGQVPHRILAALREDLARTDGLDLRRGAEITDVELWAVHAGGRTVLDAVEAGYRLPQGALAWSRDVLAAIGNVSSATIMFVLSRMLKAGARGPGMGLAFGPGITAESFRFDCV